jgi:hypothetical protein
MLIFFLNPFLVLQLSNPINVAVAKEWLLAMMTFYFALWGPFDKGSYREIPLIWNFMAEI